MANTDSTPKWRALPAILGGALLIAVLVPCLQWIGRGAVGNSAELDVPAPGAVAMLAALVAVIGVLRLLWQRQWISRQSLVTLYVMLTVSLPFCNFGLVQGFYASMTAVAAEHLDRQVPTIKKGYTSQNPKFFPKLSEKDYETYTGLAEEARANPTMAAELQSQQTQILKPLKQFWSGVAIDRAERERLEGSSWIERARSAWRTIPWPMWRPVMLWWGALLLLVLAGMLLLAERFSRDWIERENLPFPAAQLALGLVEDTGLFRNAFFWSGAGIAGLLLLLGGLAHYHIVNLPLTGAVTFQRIDFRAIFVSPPWSILAENFLFLSPVMIGLFLLVHQDILKGALWVFAGLMALRFVAGISEEALRSSLGAAWQGNALPYFAELGAGALVVFAIALLLRSRGGWWGLLAIGACIVAWWYVEGLEGWRGIFFLAFFAIWTFLAGIALARARTEGGLPHVGTRLPGSEVTYNTGNVATHGLGNVLAFNESFFIAISALPGLLAAQLEGLYLGRHFQVKRRTMLTAIAVAFGVALGVGLVSFLVLSYSYGSQNIQPFLQRMAKFPLYDTFAGGDVVYQAGSDVLRVWMIPVGALVMAGLLWARRRYPRFPVAPVSFLIICLGTFTIQRAGEAFYLPRGNPINIVWGPVLIAFLLKSLVLRYGGMDLYVRSRPVALGLIFGQCLMIVFWNVFHFVASPDVPLFVGVFQ